MPASAPETAASSPAFTLPAALLSDGFSLRPETDGDIPFLMALFASTREEELARTPWSPEQKSGFLAMQFNAQRAHYRTHMSGAEWIILLRQGSPIGRLYLHWLRDSIDLIDIALVPAWRGMGVGSAIMQRLLALSDRVGKPIWLFVERFNPALRLYTRLGFVEVKDDDVYLEMRRDPVPAASDAVS